MRPACSTSPSSAWRRSARRWSAAGRHERRHAVGVARERIRLAHGRRGEGGHEDRREQHDDQQLEDERRRAVPVMNSRTARTAATMRDHAPAATGRAAATRTTACAAAEDRNGESDVARSPTRAREQTPIGHVAAAGPRHDDARAADTRGEAAAPGRRPARPPTPCIRWRESRRVSSVISTVTASDHAQTAQAVRHPREHLRPRQDDRAPGTRARRAADSMLPGPPRGDPGDHPQVGHRRGAVEHRPAARAPRSTPAG